MRFSFAPALGDAACDRLAGRIGALLVAAGHEEVAGTAADDAPDLVFNLTDADEPRAHYLRPNASVFVVSLVESAAGDAWPEREALRRATYGILVKTMSNLVIHRVRGGSHGGRAWFVTPELGFRHEPDDAGLAARIVAFVTPLAAARVVIDNRIDIDLPEALHGGDAASRSLMTHGRALSAMNLLPSVFDLSALLEPRDLRTIRKVFGLKQLSYGNLSVRRDADSFWMSARGADKGRLEVIGRDVFLVKGYDPASAQILLSVPPGSDPDARVSVDAIEHFKIYDALPAVGAVVHVHAWMEGVEATSQSWPCGTEELADEVLEIVLRQPDSSRAVVGLKNHGLTITGPSLEDVFERMRGRLTQDVPALV